MANRQTGWKVLTWTALVVGLAAPVAAQSECASDTDCELGFSCEVVGMDAGCAVAPCMEGSECPPVVCEEAEEILGCVPARDCASDADCAEGFTCVTREYESCTMSLVPDCPPEGDCQMSKPEPGSCETVTESACIARYEAPCTVDADCGSGFTCEEVQSCWCTGGGATPEAGPMLPADGGMEDPATPIPPIDEPTCGCDPIGEFMCQLIETECTTDADCTEGMTCQPDPNGVACSGGTGDADAGGSAGGEMAPLPPQEPAVDAGVDMPNEETLPADPIERPACPELRSLCLPPNYHTGGSVGFVDGRAEDGDDGTVAPTSPSPAAEQDSNANGGTVAFGDLGSGEASDKSGSLGCSVAEAGTGFSQFGIIALSLLGMRRRRRR